jgi:predicted adenylyl cyclase CyaB
MKEIEILVEVLDKKETALAILEKFEFKGEKEIIDTYFFDPLRKESQPEEGNYPTQWLRIRKKGDKNYITFKEDLFEKNIWTHSEELETEIKDIKIVEEIIKKLGLKELVKIKNRKHTFETKDYEIVLEEVENLGLFLEVEKLNVTDDENVNKTKKEIQQFVDNLKIKTTGELNLGKPELMLRTYGTKSYRKN